MTDPIEGIEFIKSMQKLDVKDGDTIVIKTQQTLSLHQIDSIKNEYGGKGFVTRIEGGHLSSKLFYITVTESFVTFIFAFLISLTVSLSGQTNSVIIFVFVELFELFD